MNGGPVGPGVAGLKPHRDRDEAIAACAPFLESNRGRLRYDPRGKRGWPVGSGVVESGCKRIVGSRFTRSGCR